MSYLRKIKFTVISGVTFETPIYGYLETLTSAPVYDALFKTHVEYIIGIYDVDGNRLDVAGKLPNTYWQVLPFSAHVFNDDDFNNAIEAFREYT